MGGIQVKPLAHLLVDGVLKVGNIPGKLLAKNVKKRQIQQDAGLFHFGQDWDKAHFQVTVQAGGSDLLQPGGKGFNQTQGHGGVRGRVGRCLRDGHLRHTNLVPAGTDERFDVGHLHAQPDPGLGL